ncbi:hypothetical protein PT974_01561 [Cladobotryum mycophilum]|uniref:Uncharacterized protein n=1 Tax=Cladobotryum mycophilum TaxID=491253 RepID=A0ABR0T5B7_9HYPO
MHFQLIPVAAMLLGVLVPSTQATVALGTITFSTSQGSKKWNAAWIEGEGQDKTCGRAATISTSDQNPCGRKFRLSNGFTYSLAGCGDSSFRLLNDNGSFNNKCRFVSDNFNGFCGMHRQWNC